MEIGDLTESGLKDDDVGDWRLKMEIGDLTGSGPRCSDAGDWRVLERWRSEPPPAPSGVSSIFFVLFLDKGSVRGRPGEPAGRRHLNLRSSLWPAAPGLSLEV